MADEVQTPAVEATAEAVEIKAEIKDTEAQAVQAHKVGDEDRAAKLEAKVDGLATDLSEVVKSLQTLAKRPFAPAPQPVAKAEAKPDETPEVSKVRTRRFGSATWFGDRAYED